MREREREKEREKKSERERERERDVYREEDTEIEGEFREYQYVKDTIWSMYFLPSTTSRSTVAEQLPALLEMVTV